MNLLPFDSDQNFGDVGGSIGVPVGGGVGGSIGVSLTPTGSRVVTVRVRKSMSIGEALVWPISLYSNSGLNSQIRSGLASFGWSISNVVQTQSFGDGYAEWVIAAHVLNQYTDGQVLTNMRNDMANIVGGNVTTAIVSSQAVYVNGATGQLSDQTGRPIATAPSGLDQFFSNLGLGLGGGLGLGTPVLLLGAGIVLVLILKK